MTNPDWLSPIRNPLFPKGISIPVYSPVFTGNEKKYLNECIDTEWVSPKGPFVRRFEKQFASYCGAYDAIATSSGTAAIFLGLIASGIGPGGDEVILPSFTMISTALAVRDAGAIPVFADCDGNTGNIRLTDIAKVRTGKTKCLIPVHIYGNPCNLEDGIEEYCRAHRIAIVEDAAEAFGSTMGTKKTGGKGRISAFSLYVNKIITTGQGGMLTVPDKKTYDELSAMNNYYFSQKRHFWHEKPGYNLRMSNLQAALGVAQLEQADNILAKKRLLASWYQTHLHNVQEKITMLPITPGAHPNYWHIAYRIFSRNKETAQKLREHLACEGIETRSFFIPLHLQPAFAGMKHRTNFPNSERLCRTGILLPSGPSLTEKQVEKVSSVIIKYYKNNK